MATRFHKQQFDQLGVVFPATALSPEAASALLPRYYELKSRTQNWVAGAQILKSHLVSTWVAELIRDAEILDVVEEILGPDILCWTASFFAKEPHSAGYVGWHQDISYWGLDPAERVVTAWLGLTDAQPDNGCMCVIPGTHNGPTKDYIHAPGSENMLLAAQEMQLSPTEQDSVLPVALNAGQFSVHHSRLIHGSYGNESSRPRVGLSINYVATDVSQTMNEGSDFATLVRGVDNFGKFSLEERPSNDFDDAAIAQYRKSILAPSGIGGTNNEVYDTSPDISRIA